jgi:hypothetical protein
LSPSPLPQEPKTIARQALADEIGDEDELERLQAGWPDR